MTTWRSLGLYFQNGALPENTVQLLNTADTAEQQTTNQFCLEHEDRIFGDTLV